MNDISVKTVESPKGVVAEASPAPEIRESEVDPLAIDEDAAKSHDDEPVSEPVVEKIDCDEIPKEESSTVSLKQDEQKDPVTIEDGKAELKTEETSLLTDKPEEAVETVEPEAPATTINLEIVDQPAEITPEPQSAILDFDPPTPDLTTPPPAELPDDVQDPPPEPVEEVKDESPKLSSPEIQAVAEPEVTTVPEKPIVEEVKTTDVEMTEVPVPAKEPKQMPVPVPEIIINEEAPIPSIEIKLSMPEKGKESKVPVVEEKVELKVKPMQPVNGDIAKEEQATKRRASEEVETDSPLKKLCQEVEKTFPQHDTMINDYIQTATKNNIDEIQRHTEQLLAEIQTLRELAQKKEHEWNNILHLKKVKEEILLRLLRRKQVLSFEKSAEVNGGEHSQRPGVDPFDFLNQAKNLAIDKSDEISGLSIKQTGSTMNPMMQAPVMPVTTHFNPMTGLPPPYDKVAQMHMQNMPKPVFPQPLMMPGPIPGFPRDMNGQLPSNFNMPMGRQGPTKDVKSIIADYRQRNPDITPRRGRRMKSILNPNMMNAPRAIAPKVDSMNNMNSLSNLNMLFNNLDMNQKAMLERLQQIQGGGLPNSIFKDALVQFANMQQASSGLLPTRPSETITNRPEHHVKERRRERNHEPKQQQPERMPSTSPRLPPPPPYPEISLLPVTTGQEAQGQQNSLLHGILTKNCGEITITPVQPTPPPDPQPEKPEEVVQLDDEESPVSESEAAGSPAEGSGRLVIDEGGAEPAEAPLCQGCRRRDAQFVCAGCANQWYCSRDCQVAAWDEHSDMCSG